MLRGKEAMALIGVWAAMHIKNYRLTLRTAKAVGFLVHPATLPTGVATGG